MTRLWEVPRGTRITIGNRSGTVMGHRKGQVKVAWPAWKQTDARGRVWKMVASERYMDGRRMVAVEK